MSALALGATMQAIADRLVAAGVVTDAYGWPNRNATPISAIVSYPASIEFDATFGRGSDKAVFPVFVICGDVAAEDTRDVLSVYVSGVGSVKDALDGTLGGVVQTARVTDCEIAVINLAGVDYMAARYEIEVYS